MSFVLGGLAVLAFTALIGRLFLTVNPQSMATALRWAGPGALGLAGVILMLLGRGGLGGMLLSGAAALLATNRRRRAASPTPGRRSMVRTAALEMELDHDTGALEGHVLAGSMEGRGLQQLNLDELLQVHRELASDAESLRLLETYLDGRFPVWREDAKVKAGSGVAGAPAAGPMSKQEAYEILGLEAGASASAIRQAHRRLMQRLHPDLGGTTFLAARINEAKDVLLSHHD